MLFVILGLLVAQQQPVIHPPIHKEYFELPVAPPVAWPLQGTITDPAPSAPDGEILIFTTEKKVKFKWLTGVPFSYQTTDVSYWPTAAAAVGGNVVVAGKRRNLNTRIELWEFDRPMPPESSGYSAPFTTRVLYDANAPGKRRVRFLNPVLSPEGERSILVHFGDSNDVYQMEVDTGTMSLVVSVQQQPALSCHEWQGVSVIDHDSAGYLYSYFADPSTGLIDHLVLVDANRDGLIDTSMLLDSITWRQDLGNPANWLSVHDG